MNQSLMTSYQQRAEAKRIEKTPERTSESEQPPLPIPTPSADKPPENGIKKRKEPESDATPKKSVKRKRRELSTDDLPDPANPVLEPTESMTMKNYF